MMFTKVDKAIVAAVMAVAFLSAQFGFAVPAWFTQDWLASMIALLTPVAVYFIPNKETKNETF